MFASFNCFHGGNIKPRVITIDLSRVVALEEEINDQSQGKLYMEGGLEFALERADFNQLKTKLIETKQSYRSTTVARP